MEKFTVNLEEIDQLQQAIEQLQHGNFESHLPEQAGGPLQPLVASLDQLAHTLAMEQARQRKLDWIARQINSGLFLEDILELVYDEFRQLIPYNRVGLSLLEGQGDIVRAVWARTDQPVMRLNNGYTAPLSGSSLQKIIETRQPRILNDLEAYLCEHPDSNSTRLILAEGIRSSMTCPLIAEGRPLGFIFFSSCAPNTYADIHVELFLRLADQLAMILEKGRLVSELTLARQTSERQNQELSMLNEMKNTFLGMAAHDLRSPLSIIQTTADLLVSAGSELDALSQKQLLESVGRQARHMLNLINNLLDLSSIESGKMQLYVETFDLPMFLREIVRSQDDQALSKNTRVTFVSQTGEPVVADPQRLRQAIDNLITNAVKYSPPGSTIRVTAQSSAGNWIISVQDQGPGLTEADREQLFQPFARLSARPTGGEKSTGLGLAITHWIVEAHGGEIGAETQPGQGARFWIKLPSVPPVTSQPDTSGLII